MNWEFFLQTALLTFHQLTRLSSITRYKTAMFISLADSNWKQPLYPQFSNFYLNYPETKQQISYLIASPLCAIFNQSIISGVLPDEWKLSKVDLCWNNLNNYRPISIVPAVTKVFERIIYDQLNSYLTENIILFRVVNQVLDHFILLLPLCLKLQTTEYTILIKAKETQLYF